MFAQLGTDPIALAALAVSGVALGLSLRPDLKRWRLERQIEASWEAHLDRIRAQLPGAAEPSAEDLNLIDQFRAAGARRAQPRRGPRSPSARPGNGTAS